MTNLRPSPYHALLARHALPQVCTPTDVGLATGLHEATIRRHLRNGLLPGRRLGSRWLIERDELLACLRPEWERCGDCARWIVLDAAVRAPSGLLLCRACAQRLDHPAGGGR